MRMTEEGLIRSIASEEEFLAYNEEPEKAEERLTYYQKSTLFEYNGKKYFKIYSNDIPDTYNSYVDLDYGSLNQVDSKYFLPDFINFNNSKVVFYITGMVPAEDKYFDVGISYNYSAKQFTLDMTGIDLDIIGNTVRSHFIILHEIDNSFWQSFSSKIMDVDYVTQAKITDLAKNLFDLWNDSYFRIAVDLYGKDIFDNKILQLNTEHSSAYNKYQYLLQRLISCINAAGVVDSMGKTVTNEGQALSQYVRNSMIATSETFASYADLIEQRNQLTTAIGGIGTRLDGDYPNQYNRTFRGYYNTYIDYIKLFILKKGPLSAIYELPKEYPDGLYQKIQSIQQKQDD